MENMETEQIGTKFKSGIQDHFVNEEFIAAVSNSNVINVENLE